MGNERPIKIIFDTDPGIDDAMAILFAHLSPAVELLGLSTVFGNAAVSQTTRNALYLRERFDLGCAVHMGAARPLCVVPDPPPAFVHGHDGLGDAGIVTPQVTEPGDAVRYLIDSVRKYPGEITILAVGRMTNLAIALALAPDIADLVRSIVIMGGSTGLHGNGGNVTPVAEANIFGDPHAAEAVMRANWNVTMVGLDVTLQTLMSPDLVDELAAEAGDAGAFIHAITRHYQRFYHDRTGSDAFPVHDSLALAYVIRPDLFEVAHGAIRVLTDGPGLGQTVFANHERVYPDADWTTERTIQRVCLGVDSAAVLDLYQQTLLGTLT